MHGVGPLTAALAFVLIIESPNRFETGRMVGAYASLVLAMHQSGDSDSQKRIYRRGDQMLRRLLVGCAQYILGPFGRDSALRRHGLKIAERGGKGAKNRVAVAVARELAVLPHALWTVGEV